MLRRFLQWFSGLSLTAVATHSQLAGLALSAIGLHWGLVMAVVPIVAWAVLRKSPETFESGVYPWA